MTFFHPRIFPRFRQNRTTGRIFCSGAMVNGHFPLKSLKDNVFRPSFLCTIFSRSGTRKNIFPPNFPSFLYLPSIFPRPKNLFFGTKKPANEQNLHFPGASARISSSSPSAELHGESGPFMRSLHASTASPHPTPEVLLLQTKNLVIFETNFSPQLQSPCRLRNEPFLFNEAQRRADPSSTRHLRPTNCQFPSTSRPFCGWPPK